MTSMLQKRSVLRAIRGQICNVSICVATMLVGACGASVNDGFKTELTAGSETKVVGATVGAPTAVGAPKNAPALGGQQGPQTVSTSPRDDRNVVPGQAAGSAVSGDAYRIGKQDVLDISVFKVPELSKIAQVANDGSISYPLLGDVAAEGKTAQELERDLKTLLKEKYLQKPQVSVTVKEYNSQRVLVDGAVIKPGLYPIQGRSSLMQLVASSGGLTPNADATVVIFRTVEGKRAAARFDVEEIRAGRVEDPAVRSGDVIVASTSAFKDGLDKVLKVLPIAGVFALL